MKFDIDSWCESFKALPVEQMDMDMSRVFLACIMGDINRESMEQQFLYQVITKRAEALGLTIEQALVDFLTFLCRSPGDSTMYLALLKNEQVQGKHANIENFTMIFATGFPNRDELSKLWDCQKMKDAPLGNALDLNWWDEV